MKRACILLLSLIFLILKEDTGWEMSFYEKDQRGWYLAYGNLHKKFNFRDMDSETLENLISLDESLDNVVERICSDIDAMSDILNTLRKS